jgi:hypothetical protein
LKNGLGNFSMKNKLPPFIDVFSMAYVVGPSMILWTWMCNYSKCEHDPMILDRQKF